MTHKFTHAADAAARIVLRNALFPFVPKSRLSKLIIPWTTYTDPEVAHVGIGEAEAEGSGIALETHRVDLADVDRALLDGVTDGFLKVHVARGTDRILGATLVSAHAGESIGELVLAMQRGIGLGRLSGVIHPYPTQAEIIRKAGDSAMRARLSPRTAGILRRVMAWQR